MERAKKDTRIVRVKRGKEGLGFSFKGGKEHGVPILVCDVERKGATGTRCLHHRHSQSRRIHMVVVVVWSTYGEPIPNECDDTRIS